MEDKLSARSRLVLQAVIDNYIATAEPVSSQTILRTGRLHVSSATIRNVMAELEEIGYLTHPHVSAGRVPTPLGLRFYVESLLEVRDLEDPLRSRLERAIVAQAGQSFDEILKAASRALSAISRQAVVVAVPDRQEYTVYRRMEFILLQPGVVLVVFVSNQGEVQNRVIEVEEEINQNELDSFSGYLNNLLVNLTLKKIKAKLISELALEKAKVDKLINRALRLGGQALAAEAGDRVLVEGHNRLMDAPGFVDARKLKQAFNAFENKSTLIRLLEKSMAAPGVQVFIGADNPLSMEMEGVTAIMASYGGEHLPLGALGVIGPMHMDYMKVIPVVDYTAQLISSILESS
ncbi:MAG: heat-inducible transcriptional repressor HrcA [Desulfarculales bacterium]|nr:heat-inducible transcriptional repressor HrcA [Desulfarculales bacterium]